MAETDKKPKHDFPDVAPEAEIPFEELMPFPWVTEDDDRLMKAVEKFVGEKKANKDQASQDNKAASKVRQEMDSKISKPTDESK